MNLATIILKELSRCPLRRTDLEQCSLQCGGTHATFEGIFYYLIQGGFIQKSSKQHLAKYAITERGTKLLEALK
jgi:predicted transcriptional regulator